MLGTRDPLAVGDSSTKSLIAMTSMPAVPALAPVGLHTGPVCSTAGLADSFGAQIAMVAFAALAFVPPCAFASISARLTTFTELTAATLKAHGTDAFARMETRPSIQTGGAAVSSLTAGSKVARRTYTHTWAHTQATVHTSRGAQGFLTVHPIKPILTLADLPFIAVASIATTTRALCSLTRFEEDGVVWCPQDDVSSSIHHQDGHLKCCHTILVTSTWEAHLDHRSFLWH